MVQETTKEAFNLRPQSVVVALDRMGFSIEETYHPATYAKSGLYAGQSLRISAHHKRCDIRVTIYGNELSVEERAKINENLPPVVPKTFTEFRVFSSVGDSEKIEENIVEAKGFYNNFLTVVNSHIIES